MPSGARKFVASAARSLSGVVTIIKRGPRVSTPLDSVTLTRILAPKNRADSVAESGEDDESLVGLIVDGRYEVMKLLGRGGQGVVYEVRHTIISKRFAMKVLRYRQGRTLEMSERLRLEARALANIRSPNIVDVYSFGTLPDGSTYAIMELLEGASLRRALESRSIQSLHDALLIAKEIALGLAAAHQGGVIHRDLKPENVFLCLESQIRRAKILDFGLAKVIADDQKLTALGELLGTLYYMSPEQALGKEIDHRTDIYSFGVSLFELVAGRVPFDAETPSELVGKLVNDPAPALTSALSSSRIRVAEVQTIVHRCLEKDPRQRYQSIQRVIDDIEAILTRPDTERAAARSTRNGFWTVGLVGAAVITSLAYWRFGEFAKDAPPPPLPIAVPPVAVTGQEHLPLAVPNVAIVRGIAAKSTSDVVSPKPLPVTPTRRALRPASSARRSIASVGIENPWASAPPSPTTVPSRLPEPEPLPSSDAPVEAEPPDSAHTPVENPESGTDGSEEGQPRDNPVPPLSPDEPVEAPVKQLPSTEREG